MLRRPMRSLVATIHYFERINPQSSPAAGVVFDDISWSEDMREMWREMSGRSDFADAADRATFGICVRSAGRADPPRYWDLQEVPGRTRIGEPHGWRNE